jgi:hypothetical protein
MVNWANITIMSEAYRQEMLHQAQQERLVRELQQGCSQLPLRHKLGWWIKLLLPSRFQTEFGNKLATGRAG